MYRLSSNKVLLAFGRDGSDNELRDMWVFDVLLKEFSEVRRVRQCIPEDVSFLKLCPPQAMNDGTIRVYLVGQYNNDSHLSDMFLCEMTFASDGSLLDMEEIKCTFDKLSGFNDDEDVSDWTFAFNRYANDYIYKFNVYEL